MKRFIQALAVAAALLLPALSSAQNISIEKLMEYPGVTVVYLSPSMLRSSTTLHLGTDELGPSFSTLFRSISSVYIFSSEEQEASNFLRKTFAPMLDHNAKGFERLLFVKDGDTIVNMVGFSQGSTIQDLYLTVDEAGEYTVILFGGKFTRRQIEEAIQQSKREKKK